MPRNRAGVRGSGADVARPKHELKGFHQGVLKAGESKTVTIDLDERAFAYWSEKYNDWHVEAGEYAIEVGVSSRDIADTVAVPLDGDGKDPAAHRMVHLRRNGRPILPVPEIVAAVPPPVARPASCRSFRIMR